MDQHYYFRVNEPAVVYEVFENEIVIINFDSSNYYSLNHSGVDIWKSILDEASIEQIMEDLMLKYNGGKTLISEAVINSIEELEKEGLIVVAEAHERAVNCHKQSVDAAGKIPFLAPELEKFSDMGDMLLLDPIHEVEESGWPNKKPA